MGGSDAEYDHKFPDVWPNPKNKLLCLLALHAVILWHITDELTEFLLVFGKVFVPWVRRSNSAYLLSCMA